MVQDTMKGMIKQVVDAQKESDQKFADLEEKRFKMEETQQRGEAQMRHNDQEFQLRMFQLLTGAYSHPPPMPPGYPPYSGSQ